jgi:hypothetical protein
MIKPISPSECVDFLREFFSRPAAEALAAELFRIEDEAGENICLGANICSEWEEFPSFQAAQAAVGGAYIPDGIHFLGGGFLMRK